MIHCLTSVHEFQEKTDAALLDAYLARMAEHDQSALAELYRKTSASVYGFALSILKNAHDAEDVLHDCYITAYSAAAGYRSAGKPMAWILTITKNLCLMKIRERSRQSDMPEEDWDRWLDSGDISTQEARLVLAEYMKRLSDVERQIVVLHAVAGFKHREIAEMLELPLSNVLSKYNRALKKLKTQFGKEACNREQQGTQ